MNDQMFIDQLFYKISRLFLSSLGWISWFALIWLWLFGVVGFDVPSVLAWAMFAFIAAGAMPSNPNYRKPS